METGIFSLQTVWLHLLAWLPLDSPTSRGIWEPNRPREMWHNWTSAQWVGESPKRVRERESTMNLAPDLLNGIFLAATIGVGPFWFLMAVRPNAAITRRTMSTPWPVVAIGLVYAALVIPSAGAILETLLNPTLAEISASLATPAGSLAVWLHVLAFDLIAGRFIWLDGLSRGVGAPLRIAALTLALMFGPLGLLLHLALRPRHHREGAQAVS